MRVVSRGALVAGSLALLWSCGMGSARACLIDNKPTMRIDGLAVVRNRRSPTTPRTAATWAFFAGPITYPRDRSVGFTENRQALVRVLVPTALTHPFRWTLSDGTTATGWHIAHTFHRSGHYRVTVSCYFPQTHGWYLVDEAQVVVR